jgi:hypothetical protein
MPEKTTERQLWRLTIGITDGCYGAAYLFGGIATAPSLVLMEKVISMQVWGAILVAAGILFVTHQPLYAGLLGGVVWAMFTICSIITQVVGTATGAGGPYLLAGITVMHLLVTYNALSGATLAGKR